MTYQLKQKIRQIKQDILPERSEGIASIRDGIYRYTHEKDGVTVYGEYNTINELYAVQDRDLLYIMVWEGDTASIEKLKADKIKIKQKYGQSKEKETYEQRATNSA